MNRQTSPSSDELSLVDLAVLLVKRWKLMLVTFLLVLLAAIAVALLRPASYTYTSLYSVAQYQDEEGQPTSLETPNAVLSQVRLVFLPSETRELINANDLSRVPFDVATSQPQNTDLIALTTQTVDNNQSQVEQLHRQILEATAQSQSDLVERTQQGLERRLVAIQEAIDTTGGAGAELTKRASELESRLAALQEGEVSQIAVRSLQPEGTSAGLIVALGGVLGLVLAIIAAFVCHFACAVRQRLAQG